MSVPKKVELEGPAARRKKVAKDDMRRDLEQRYQKIPPGRINDLLTMWQAGRMDIDKIKRTLDQEQEAVVDSEFAKGGGAEGPQLVLYVTNQTGNRHVRYKCNRLKLNFVCLRIEYMEVDVAGNKWLRQKVTESAGVDAIPLLFMGLGAEGKFLGTYDDILNIIDEGTFYDYLAKFGYKHPHKKCQHFVYTGDTSKMKKIL
eukprot:TRINITY_DN29_c2_g2_i1.p1 TRINITY_DN29_c2_g2~~TRINITY_DN29_c2_g2_i1.p1  ORF type:complete len:201 (+),score=72.65 TRINITY_DN29_c2_g2_i1:450-1052(+)